MGVILSQTQLLICMLQGIKLTTLNKDLQEVKNQLSIDGSISYVYNQIMLHMYEPDAVHAFLVGLAHLAAERGYRASSREFSPIYTEEILGIPVKVNYNANT